MYTHEWKWLAHVSKKPAVVLASDTARSILQLLLLSSPQFLFSPPFLCFNFLCCFQNPRESRERERREREGKRERERLTDWLTERANFFSHCKNPQIGKNMAWVTCSVLEDENVIYIDVFTWIQSWSRGK